jgi:hypothetical protein
MAADQHRISGVPDRGTNARTLLGCGPLSPDGPIVACDEVTRRLTAADTAARLGEHTAAAELRRQAQRHADIHRAEARAVEQPR